MSFLNALMQTYENNQEVVGKVNKKRNGTEYTLLPIAHSTQVTHIEVVVSTQGEFLSAEVIVGERNTVIPVTEASSGRTSGLAPHPIHDKLMYVAGDYSDYISGKPKAREAFKLYLEQLSIWCDSEYSHESLSNLYEYLKKGTLIEDLVKNQTLHLDDDGMLLLKWQKKNEESPSIYKSVSNIADAAIRFTIEGLEPVMWEHTEIRKLHIQKTISDITELDFCYVTGKYAPISVNQPKKIRNTMDQSKLISTSNANGLIYKGRFKDARDTFNISYEASQKAHNALKWLINRQGIYIDGRVFLVWSDGTEQPKNWDELLRAGEQEAKEFYLNLTGVKKSNTSSESTYLAILDAATPGRLAVTSFEQLTTSSYYKRVYDFYNKYIWYFTHRKNDNGENQEGLAAPTLKEILSVIYPDTTRADILKNTYNTLLICVLYNRPIPREYINRAVARLKNGTEMGRWEWDKNLSITCALINYERGKGEFSVSLDTQNNNRSYLFGRLLAVAEVLERSALGSENRPTNAARYTTSFVQAPARTWTILQQKIVPYQNKLNSTLAAYYQAKIDNIISLMNPKDFSNKPLEETYLLGFYSQRQDLYTKKEKKGDKSND